MARKKKVTLAAVPSLDGAPQSLMAAKRKIRQFRRSGYRRPEAPTPERLLRAGDAARVETFSEVVEIARGDRFEPVEVDFVRMRVDDGPLARLRDRHQLDDDLGRNLALALAGEKFRDSFAHSGLDPLKSPDMASEVRTAHGPTQLWRSEAHLHALQQFRAATAAIPEDFRATVEAIVLHDRDLTDIGREVSAYRDRKSAAAVAMFILRRGLAALARHYRLISKAAA